MILVFIDAKPKQLYTAIGNTGEMCSETSHQASHFRKNILKTEYKKADKII